MQHNIQDLISLFDETFFADYQTRLIRGDDEPIYLPKDAGCAFHRVVFAHGYFASALHEIAHWCIAGEARRQQVDYGYWYAPDGRDASQQRAFEQVEVKPQAIEWAFSLAANKAFRVSTDNLNGVEPDVAAFTAAVNRQLSRYVSAGFPPRAQQFIDALQAFYGTEPVAITWQRLQPVTEEPCCA